MAERPESGGVPDYFPWATSTINEVVLVGGETQIHVNKEPPLPEHTAYGLRYDEPPNYRELNHQFQGYSYWFQHLDKRLTEGSTHLTTTSETEAQISTRLGGTWVLLGSETIGSNTVYYYNKTG